MGEAKRRGPHAPDGDKLPHFIFGRDFDTESRGGFALAGVLLTDFSKDDQAAQERGQSELGEVVDKLLTARREHPELNEAGLWRGGARPPGGLAPPFPADLLIARQERCVSIVIRIDDKPAFTASGEPGIRIWADDPALRKE
jgi:hypothetical protein